tara:strand:+ start:889 stop:1104 length:216 start_codon:yes stop_codon:yes gene_type:complete
MTTVINKYGKEMALKVDGFVGFRLYTPDSDEDCIGKIVKIDNQGFRVILTLKYSSFSSATVQVHATDCWKS